MKKSRIIALAAVLLAVLPLFMASAEGSREFADKERELSFENYAFLPFDPNVVRGRLDNGMTYYIRENRRPENRAVLRLVIDAGSVLEDDDQKGLAHFLEHMAFNGTENFSKQEIIDFMESIGMQFGPEVNAHTSFDETVYKLVIPMDNPETVDKAFRILEDWARNLTLDPGEIDKERGVVIGEWREGRGAEARMRDEYLPVLFRDSQYAERLPIGNDVSMLRTFTHEALGRFYRDWYRPELMAVVAVGDFDRNAMETLIRNHFSDMPGKENPRERIEYRIPDHRETLYSIVTDAEATYTMVDILYKYDPPGTSRVRDYRRMIAENLYNMMFNQRLEELTRQAEPPFLAAQSANYRIVRTKYLYNLVAIVNEGDAAGGIETLLTEAKRVEQYGFTPGELERAKQDLMSSVETAYTERDKTESVRLADEYVSHYLDLEPAPGIVHEYEMYRKFLPGIALEEVNRLGDAWIKDENRMVLVKAPEKEGVPVPTEAELEAALLRVNAKKIEPYQDAALDKPLMETPPAPGRITAEKRFQDLGVTEWTLSNGIKVILKPTTFKNDQILFASFSPGGSSLVPDSRFMSAETATSIVVLSGLGEFDYTQLQKKLAGKSVSVTPYIDELLEGFSGQTRPADLETAFQLVNLYFTGPRLEETAFRSYMERMRGFIRNRLSEPETVYQDLIEITMSQGHFRRRPLSVETLSEVDMQAAYEVYRQRFSDAGDFTFVFTGNFTLESIRPLVTTYLASLPDRPGKETWKDPGVEPPRGVIEKSVRRGLEPKSIVSLIWSGPYTWSLRNRFLVDALQGVLDIRLREAVREEAGGTYGVSVRARSSHYPDEEYRLEIEFTSDPDRVDELSGVVRDELMKLRDTAPDALYLTKVKEIQKRSYEQNLRENGFWLRSLQDAYFHGYNPSEILAFPAMVDSLTAEDVRETARKLVDPRNYVRVVLYPEAESSAAPAPKP